MNRRSVLLGMGTAAAGAGAVFGSGAFTQVQAERDLTIGVDEDSSALLQLSANSDVVASVANGDNGELVIDTDRLSTENEESSQGFAVGSTVDIGEINNDGTVSSDGSAFTLTNNFDDVGDESGDLDVAIDLTSIDLSGADGLSSLEFYGTPRNNNGTQVTSAGGRSVFDVASDETIDFAIRFTTTSTTGPEGLDDATVTFQAGSDLTSGDFPTEQPAGVTRTSDGTSFTSIQAAIDDGNTESGETLTLGNDTYTESATINVDSLTLEAAEGASPTVDASGIDGGSIPVLVDGVDDVTVDDANIAFKSGINVGADFSEYDPGITETSADAIVTSDATESDEFESIGAALNEKGANTKLLVKSNYNASKEDSDNAGSGSALISIVHNNVELISQDGPTETVIDERPDATGSGRAVDINAANVVFKGFDVSNAAQEGIVVTGVENAEGIKITDNKVTSDVDGIIVSKYSAQDFNSASTDGILIANNEINHERFGVSLSNGATEPVVKHNTIVGNGNERGIALNHDGEGVTNATVEANLVETSHVGFQRSDDGSTVESLSNNHFINNDLLAIANSASGQLDATENFFGTEDRQTIKNKKIGGSGGDTVFDPFAAVEIDPDAGE